MSHHVLAEVLAASKQWVKHFNHGDIDYCVSGYMPDAILQANPMGEYVGKDNIDNFWRPFIQSGATDLHYKDMWLKQVGDEKVHLGANWSMNVGKGIIILEEWVKNDAGVWKLSQDFFEVQEQY